MVISNEIYENALNNMDNLMIMHSAGSCFLNVLDDDEIHRCKLIALWKALQSWKPNKGRKFTAFLYQRVCWECLKSIHYNKKHKNIQLDNIDQEVLPDTAYCDILDCLSMELRDIVTKRYVYGMTLREIGDEYGYCYETIRKRLKKAVEHIQNEIVK